MLLSKELAHIYEKLNGACALVEDIEEMTCYDDPQASEYAKEAVDILKEVLCTIRDSLDEEPSDLNFEEDN